MTTITHTTAPPITPGRWTVDPHHSQIGFAIRHLGVSKVRGHFGRFDAALVVGRTLADVEVTATIDLASIDTGNADRDAHVRSADLLDVARRPTMTFRSVAVRGSGTDWTMDGELTIGEVRRPLTLAVEFGGIEHSTVDDRRHAGFEASGELRRSDFGLHFGAGDAILGNLVRVQLDMQFVEPSAPRAGANGAERP